MSIKNFFKNLFAPEPLDADNGDNAAQKLGIPPTEVTANQILDAVKENFLLSAKILSTPYNYLFHTSYIIYIKASNFSQLSASLPFLAGGLEKMLVEMIRKRISADYPSYRPHSQYWQFQLVEIPEDAEIDGVTEEEIEKGALIQIRSDLFPPTEDEVRASASSDRVVTTVHGVNSLKAIRNCINPDILATIDLIEKDRIRLNFVLDKSEPHFAGRNTSPHSSARKTQAPVPQPSTMQMAAEYYATLEAQDGEFLEGAAGRRIHTIAMTDDEIHIVGRSSMPGHPGVQIARVNSDRILTPHVKIRRNPSAGTFELSAIGPTRLNQRLLKPDPNAWIPLPKKSTFILDDEIQLCFRATASSPD